MAQALVAFGDYGHLSMSMDGEIWTAVENPFQDLTFTTNTSIEAMAHSATRVMIVGGEPLDGGEYNALFATAPLTMTSWSEAQSLPIGGYASTVTYSPELGRWLVGSKDPSSGLAALAYSDDDGATWTVANDGDLPGFMSGVNQVLWISAFNLFLAVGESDSTPAGLWVSLDGETWDRPVSGDGAAATYLYVGYAPEVGRAVVAGFTKFLSSDDGLNWTADMLPISEIQPFINQGAWAPDLGYFLFGGSPGAIA